MIDNFLAELFGQTPQVGLPPMFPSAGGLTNDPTFDQMAGVKLPAPSLMRPDPQPQPPFPIPDLMTKLAGGMPTAPMPTVGPSAATAPMPVTGPSARTAPMPVTPMSLEQKLGGPTTYGDDTVPPEAQFAGATVAPGATPGAAPAGDAKAQMMKKIFSSLAGGFSGADKRFGGGALMNGIGGSLTGGLKSDQQDRENTRQDSEDERKANNEAARLGISREALDERKKTGEALRKLYGDRGTAAINGRPSAAWNKPPHERYKDAQKLVQDQEKIINGRTNPYRGPEGRQKWEAEKKGELDSFKKNTYKMYGIDAEGKDTGPPADVPGNGSTPRPGGGAKLLGTGTEKDPYQPQTQEDFDALPAGAIFRNPADPDGPPLRKRKTSALESADMVA